MLAQPAEACNRAALARHGSVILTLIRNGDIQSGPENPCTVIALPRTHSVAPLKPPAHHIFCCLRLIVVAMCLPALPAAAQRVQFNSLAQEGVATSPPMVPVTPPPTWSAPPSTLSAPTVSAGAAYDPYAPAATQAPAPLAAPAPYSPYAPSPYSPTPQALYPDGIAMPQMMPPGGFTFGEPTRFMQAIRVRDTQLLDIGSQPLGVNDLETSVTFAVPFFRTSAPLLITPGFAMHWFQGPVTGPPPDDQDFPPRTYDAYIDAGWHPQVTPWFGANLGVRVGAYTDFNTFNNNSIRIMGRGLGIVTLTPTVQIAAGVVYIDRVKIKILPAGGIMWHPNPDAHYDILFPNPKLAHRWTTLGNTELWYYVSGEYGGGSWTIQRIGFTDQADYNDVRVNLGLDTFGYRGLHGFFEVGYAWKREIVYRSDVTPNYDASGTVMLRGGLDY